MAYFATTTASSTSRTSSLTTAFPWTKPMKLIRLAQLWMYRLFCTPLPVLFLISSIGTFAGLTYLAVHYYGPVALQEGLLYHFSRVDHRHNYSMYWYWIYLARGKVEGHAAATTIAASSSSSFSVLGRVLLLPQVFLLAYSSIGIAPYNNNLGLALFVQTFLFVTNNKVITAQYFTWYLCLLPLCTTITIQPSSSSPRSKIRVIKALIILLLSIGLWLGSAYLLEMQGLAVHLLVWMSSVLYYFANVHLMGVLLSIQSSSKSNQTGITSNNRTKKVN
jgi:phosphatidylinositol glycan class M